MKIPYEFLESYLEVPAIRLLGAAKVLLIGGTDGVEDIQDIRVLVAYAHLQRYTPAESALGLLCGIKGTDVISVVIVNRVVALINEEKALSLATGEEVGPEVLQDIYEQHGVSVGLVAARLNSEFTAWASRAALRQRPGGAGGAPQGTPEGTAEGTPVSPGDPGSP